MIFPPIPRVAVACDPFGMDPFGDGNPFADAAAAASDAGGAPAAADAGPTRKGLEDLFSMLEADFRQAHVPNTLAATAEKADEAPQRTQDASAGPNAPAAPEQGNALAPPASRPAWADGGAAAPEQGGHSVERRLEALQRKIAAASDRLAATQDAGAGAFGAPAQQEQARVAAQVQQYHEELESIISGFAPSAAGVGGPLAPPHGPGGASDSDGATSGSSMASLDRHELRAFVTDDELARYRQRLAESSLHLDHFSSSVDDLDKAFLGMAPPPPAPVAGGHADLMEALGLDGPPPPPLGRPPTRRGLNESRRTNGKGGGKHAQAAMAVDVPTVEVDLDAIARDATMAHSGSDPDDLRSDSRSVSDVDDEEAAIAAAEEEAARREGFGAAGSAELASRSYAGGPGGALGSPLRPSPLGGAASPGRADPRLHAAARPGSRHAPPSLRRSPEGGLSVGLGAGTGSVGVGSPTMGSAHAHHGALSSPAPDVHGRVSVNAVELDALHQELAALLQWKQNAEDTMGRLHHQLGMSHQLIFELTESVRALSDQQRQLGDSVLGLNLHASYPAMGGVGSHGEGQGYKEAAATMGGGAMGAGALGQGARGRAMRADAASMAEAGAPATNGAPLAGPGAAVLSGSGGLRPSLSPMGLRKMGKKAKAKASKAKEHAKHAGGVARGGAGPGATAGGAGALLMGRVPQSLEKALEAVHALRPFDGGASAPSSQLAMQKPFDMGEVPPHGPGSPTRGYPHQDPIASHDSHASSPAKQTGGADVERAHMAALFGASSSPITHHLPHGGGMGPNAPHAAEQTMQAGPATHVPSHVDMHGWASGATGNGGGHPQRGGRGGQVRRGAIPPDPWRTTTSTRTTWRGGVGRSEGSWGPSKPRPPNKGERPRGAPRRAPKRGQGVGRGRPEPPKATPPRVRPSHNRRARRSRRGRPGFGRAAPSAPSRRRASAPPRRQSKQRGPGARTPPRAAGCPSHRGAGWGAARGRGPSRGRSPRGRDSGASVLGLPWPFALLGFPRKRQRFEFRCDRWEVGSRVWRNDNE